ncbi:SDR family oxidoreductase [Pseudactinotalea suaedae]|uniref:SDR family oxidoreductase n=1 Tax=Pseudactinotalea suaedae TaxID=1524924 RepID=UPI0012E2ED76|nr:SDR family oxidoreductase [Pseudactinotalea suaedae]
MADIVVIGAHGKVAQLALPLLVQAGHQVHGVVRKPDQVRAVEDTGAHATLADIEHHDTRGIATLLRGHKAVIWSAGAGGGDPSRTWAVDRDAAIRTMDAAASVGVQRFVMVSYFGAGPEHDVPPDSSFFPYAQAKSVADGHLALTNLAWTILRPSRLTDDAPTGKISVGTDQSAGSVSRGDVAAVIAQAVVLPRAVGKIYEFNNGEVPIAEALEQGGWHPPVPEAVGPLEG